MYSQTSLADTVTYGIQDISAILPLLGTDQCEEHMGTALVKGYLYTCVTPISIFGSLGIVKAGFNVFVAAIIVRSWKFLGAQRLADGGFRPKGQVAKLIALDPHSPKRFLAESNLEKILKDEHIENIEDLQVSWAAGSLSWNIKMAIFTVFASTLGIIPYLYIILHRSADEPSLILSGWGFPILRIIGNAITGILVQIIVQIRLLIIIKHRLVFLIMDRYINAPSGRNHLDERHKKKLMKSLSVWRTGVASEMCLWELDTFLKANKAKAPSRSTMDTKTVSPNDTILLFPVPENHQDDFYDYSSFETFFRNVKRSHLPKLHHSPWNVTPAGLPKSWQYIFLNVLLLISLVSSVGGYIGCFNLVQRGTHAGPILWLLFEILLCLLRIAVWAWNPPWDDNQGITFDISLASKSPLVTCSVYGRKLEADNEVPIVRSNTFLREIASFTGPIPALQWTDAALYYILTGSEYRSIEAAPIEKVLYIVVSAFKEQTSRLVVKRKNEKHFSFFVCKLHPDPHRTVINVNTSGKSTTPETHVLTSNPDFVDKLSKHYDTILQRINDVGHGQSRQFYSNSTWALHRIDSSANSSTESADPSVLQPHLTTADFAYLNQGMLEIRRNIYAERVETWVNKIMDVFEKDIFEAISFASLTHNQMTMRQIIEINEVEYLIAEARRHIELLLLNVFRTWDHLITEKHGEMISQVITFFDSRQPSTNTTGHELKANTLSKMRGRLDLEKEDRQQQFLHFDYKRMCARIDGHRKMVEERIEKRRYFVHKEGSKILDRWSNKLGLDEFWNKPSEYLGSHHDMVEEYDGIVRARLQTKDRFLSGNEGEAVKNRCQSRVDEWKAKLKVIVEEFRLIEAPTFLKKTSFDPTSEFDTTLKYWSNAAIQQRLSLMDHVKYVIVSSKLVDDLGGFENLAFALKNSRASLLYFEGVFFLQTDTASPSQYRRARDIHTYDDTSDSDVRHHESDTEDAADSEASWARGQHVLLEKTIVDIVRGIPSITGIHFSNKSYGISSAVQAAIDENITAIFARPGPQLVCEFEAITISNELRQSRPYVLFGDPKRSRCTVKFCVDKEADHTLTLVHTFTTLGAEIGVKLNGLRLTTNRSGRYGSLNEFHEDRISIPKKRLSIRPALNIIVIELIEHSEPAKYFLGDIALQKSLKEEPMFTAILHTEPEMY